MVYSKFSCSICFINGFWCYSIKQKSKKKRADILVYNKEGKPFAIVECKASHVAISQDVFDQVARYNLVLKVPYLIVTNGLEHFYSSIDFEKDSFSFLKYFLLLQYHL